MQCTQHSFLNSSILIKYFSSFLTLQLLQKDFNILSCFFCSLLLQRFFNLFEISLAFSFFLFFFFINFRSTLISLLWQLLSFNNELNNIWISTTAPSYYFQSIIRLDVQLIMWPRGFSSILTQFFWRGHDFNLDADAQSTLFLFMMCCDGSEAFWPLTKSRVQKNYWCGISEK